MQNLCRNIIPIIDDDVYYITNYIACVSNIYFVNNNPYIKKYILTGTVQYV